MADSGEIASEVGTKLFYVLIACLSAVAKPGSVETGTWQPRGDL